MFFAHITGASIKRALPDEAKRGRAKTTISMVMLNSLVAVFILFLGKMRQAWLLLIWKMKPACNLILGLMIPWKAWRILLVKYQEFRA